MPQYKLQYDILEITVLNCVNYNASYVSGCFSRYFVKDMIWWTWCGFVALLSHIDNRKSLISILHTCVFGTYICLICILYETSVHWSPSVMRIPTRLLGDNNQFCTILVNLDIRKAKPDVRISVTTEALAELWKPCCRGNNLWPSRSLSNPAHYMQDTGR
jgi:hypothetical protein